MHDLSGSQPSSGLIAVPDFATPDIDAADAISISVAIVNYHFL
jgi:hypothetical protein